MFRPKEGRKVASRVAANRGERREDVKLVEDGAESQEQQIAPDPVGVSEQQQRQRPDDETCDGRRDRLPTFHRFAFTVDFSAILNQIERGILERARGRARQVEDVDRSLGQAPSVGANPTLTSIVTRKCL